MWRRYRIKAFTLLECLVALLVISGALLVYDGLTKVMVTNIHFLSNHTDEEWLLFCGQLRHELSGARLDKVANNRLYITVDQQAIALGQSRSDDFRKTNADGRGYQPMLYGLKASHISEQDGLVRIELTLKNGKVRTFMYAFEKAG